MEFESPDVEKDFPGLYASESGKKSNESDFSDVEGKDKPSKKEILIGKRNKEKKESKKDRGYAALEGESSPEEEITDAELKSPSKSKKTKSFKFPSKKDKQRDKHKEKENKEKEPKESKEKDGKTKLKHKEKKKSKHLVEEGVDISELAPVFGVNLSIAIERGGCHDGVQLPVVVRDCIDYLEEHGLKVEGIHRSLGMRSKVQQLRKLYNQREEVSLSGHEISVVTSLLKQFFRELPEPIVSKAVEEAAAAVGGSSASSQSLVELKNLVQQLPLPNRTILAWILTHMEHIVDQEKHNRMGFQNVSLIVGPMLMVGQRALAALFHHRRALFGEVNLSKYKPPLSAGSPCPDSVEGIEEELAKQESLLGQIHKEMNAGLVSKKREEQLWEVQRFVTNLKRKLRLLQRAHGSMQKSQEEEDSGPEKSAEAPLKSSRGDENEDFRINLKLQKTKPSIDEEQEEVEGRMEESADGVGTVVKSNIQSKPEQDKEMVSDTTAPSTKSKDESDGSRIQTRGEDDEVDGRPVVEEPRKNIDKIKETVTKEKDVIPNDSSKSKEEKVSLSVKAQVHKYSDSVTRISALDQKHAYVDPLSKFTKEELEKAAAQSEEILYLKLEHEELLKLREELLGRIKTERLLARRLSAKVNVQRSRRGVKSQPSGPPTHPPPQLMSEGTVNKDGSGKEDDATKMEESLNQMKKENEALEQKAATLTRLIFEEREACIRTKVQLSILQARQAQGAHAGV
ncbi:ralA-binding protein 1 isoform X2 [Ischnura elegans]|uniref:ralA-binding protein 1 isoform X2 n=1 Tax=Ischnura elegans TaxID=197161 RepID=UPI001ED895D1|nr:ralA-binding protein 1 isoform X2 [Ischnura elegans]